LALGASLDQSASKARIAEGKGLRLWIEMMKMQRLRDAVEAADHAMPAVLGHERRFNAASVSSHGFAAALEASVSAFSTTAM
jgi:hypothetical protein